MEQTGRADPFPMRMDGSIITNLQNHGMSYKECMPNWMLLHTHLLGKLQEDYVAAGAQMLLAPTGELAENKLRRFGYEKHQETMAARLVSITRESGAGCPVGGLLSPLGLSFYPAGETTLDEVYEIFSHSVQALCKAGVDYFAIEGMSSMAEARMALLAVKEHCDKPVMISMSIEEDGETPEDVNALAALVTLQSMGVSAFGLNASPTEDTLEQFKVLLPYTTVPLYARINGGKPFYHFDGHGDYPLSPAEFGRFGLQLAELGVAYIGGTRGTGPEHIAALGKALEDKEFPKPAYEHDPEVLIATTEKDFYFLDHTVDISKPIQCSEDMSDQIIALEEDEHSFVINAEVGHIDDVDFLARNYYMFQAPLAVSTTNIALLEAVARMYSGRIIINNRDDFDPKMLTYLSEKYGVIAL